MDKGESENNKPFMLLSHLNSRIIYFIVYWFLIEVQVHSSLYWLICSSKWNSRGRIQTLTCSLVLSQQYKVACKHAYQHVCPITCGQGNMAVITCARWIICIWLISYLAFEILHNLGSHIYNLNVMEKCNLVQNYDPKWNYPVALLPCIYLSMTQP